MEKQLLEHLVIDNPDKEVVGWQTADGKVFVLPLTGTDQSGQSSTNTQLTSNTYSSYQDSQGRTLLSVNRATAADAPERAAGSWYLDYYSFDTNGNVTITTHLVTGHVHTHPMNGNENRPSPTDVNFAANGNYPGITKYIVNQNNLVRYDATGDAGKSIQPHNCN